MLADTFRELAGTRLVDDDGEEEVLELLPPATDHEVAELEARLASPLPREIRDALGVAKGLANGPLESLSLADLGEFGLEDVFPHAHPVGHDGFGNYWLVDLIPGRPEWSPIFFACHDPPVIAFQSETLEAFVRDAVALWQPGPRSPVDIVHEDVTRRIWDSDPGTIDRQRALDAGDPALARFAWDLEPDARVVDLRSPGLGDGFAWGRHGPDTRLIRFGTERIWAVVPPRRRSLWTRFFEG